MRRIQESFRNQSEKLIWRIRLKRLAVCLAALLCVVCDEKDEVRPEWSIDMPTDAVE